MKVLHFADAHIGIETHGKIDPTTGLNLRLLDFVRCLEKVVDTAIERRVDAVLFAGDAYDYANPTPTYQKMFGEQIKRLSDEGIPTVLITGNHDMPVSFGRASPLELFGVLGVPNVHVATKPQLFRLQTKSGELQVACLPYPNRSQLLAKEQVRSMSDEEIANKMEAICADVISKMAESVSSDAPAVLLAHISVANAVYSGSERTAVLGVEPNLFLSALALPQFAYVALGHIHRHQDLNPSGSPHVVYSGSIERCDFSEEGERKGFCIVHINGGVEVEFIETPARRFITIEVDLRGESDPTLALINAIREKDIKDAIVRIRYRCTERQNEALNLKAVGEALEEAFRVVSISRLAEDEARRGGPRAVVTEEMDVIEALRRYIRHREEWKELEDDLIKYARELERELSERLIG
jgi:exonuclease SbcD